MTLTWKELAFQIEPSIATAAAKAWSWLVPEPWIPVVCSMAGGVFLEKPDGTIHWLDTATGSVEQVASDRERFEEIMRSSPDLVDYWFLPPLIERLHDAGKKAGTGECYGFTILPIFAEGRFEVDNMFVLSVTEQFVSMADLHRQLSKLPDGAKARLKVVD